jgi:hypothetical protein
MGFTGAFAIGASSLSASPPKPPRLPHALWFNKPLARRDASAVSRLMCLTEVDRLRSVSLAVARSGRDLRRAAAADGGVRAALAEDPSIASFRAVIDLAAPSAARAAPGRAGEHPLDRRASRARGA